MKLALGKLPYKSNDVCTKQHTHKKRHLDDSCFHTVTLSGSLRGLVMQEMDLLLYGDSILESLLGNQVGQPLADWADIADLWTKHHGGSKAKVLAISGVTT